jgi:hypothetical protein
MRCALCITGGLMDISHITKTILNSPLPTAKFRHTDETSPTATQQSMQAADKLTLSEEVRKLLKRKKAAALKKGKEADATEWEDIYDQEETKRGERPGEHADERK